MEKKEKKIKELERGERKRELGFEDGVAGGWPSARTPAGGPRGWNRERRWRRVGTGQRRQQPRSEAVPEGPKPRRTTAAAAAAWEGFAGGWPAAQATAGVPDGGDRKREVGWSDSWWWRSRRWPEAAPATGRRSEKNKKRRKKMVGPFAQRIPRKRVLASGPWARLNCEGVFCTKDPPTVGICIEGGLFGF
jgi:hypothetical protein